MLVETERKYLGRWDIPVVAETGGAQHIYGAITDHSIPRQVRYKIAAPVHCRLMWLKLTLPPTSQSVPDLFSFHDGPPLTGGRLAVIHAKRIMVVGKQILKDEELNLNPSPSERMVLRNMIETPPRLSRLRVSGRFSSSWFALLCILGSDCYLKITAGTKDIQTHALQDEWKNFKWVQASSW